MAKKITEHKVRSLVGKPTRYRITEECLQIEVNPSGRRVWFAQGRAQGKRFRKCLGDYPALSVKDAREAVRKVLHERDEGVRIIDDPQSFEAFVEGDFCTWCVGSRKQGDATMQRIRFTHVPMFGTKKLRDITQQDVERHKARLLKNKANATVKRDLGDLRRIFSKAVEWGLLRRSPATSVVDPKVEHSEKLYLTTAELDRLHVALVEWEGLAMGEFQSKHLPDGQHTGRYLHHPDLPKLIRVLVNTGLRKGEALALRWSDIAIEDNAIMLTVRPEVAKSGRRRRIPINKALVEHLIPSMGLSPEEARETHRVALKSRKDTRIFSLQHPAKAWLKLRKMADLDHITMHQLRHNFASSLVNKGVAIHTVAKLLGHSSIVTTQIYLSSRIEDEITAVNLL